MGQNVFPVPVYPTPTKPYGSGQYKGSVTASGSGTVTVLSVTGMGRLNFLQANSATTMTVIVDGITLFSVSTGAATYYSALGTGYSGVGMAGISFESSLVIQVQAGATLTWQYELV